MRKTRRRRYTWFPVVGSAGPAETNDDFAQLLGVFTVTPDGLTSVAINPVVPDVPMEGDQINVSQPGQLIQALGQEYYIERIVGKCFLSLGAAVDDGATQFVKTALIGCGFFVARANEDDSGGGVNTPIGSASPAERLANYNPLSPDCIREPWIWRRTWILSSGRNPAQTTAPFPFAPVFSAVPAVTSVAGAPTTNMGYGSAIDGPHFDAKSVRRVGNDERLWFVVATRTIDREFGNGDTTNAAQVALVLDYRVLGRLTKPHNRSNF